MDGLRLLLRHQARSHRRVLLWLLRRLGALPLRLHAIVSRRRRRATRAVNEELPAAEEAALGAGRPLQAEAARDDRRRRPLPPLLRRRLRTRPPGGPTKRIGNDRRNGSPWEPFLFARQQIVIRAGQEKIMPA